MNGRPLLVLPLLALVVACAEHKLPTEPTGLAAPSDPSEIISDGAHNGGNPDFFFLPPMVPLPLRNANFELGKFNNTLKSSLKIEICELQSTPVNAQGLPQANTPCVVGDPLKTFAPGTVQLVNLPVRQNGWWTLFGLPADGFYYVLWDTRQARLNVRKYYRIKVFIAGAPDVLLGIADVDPMANLSQWKFTLTGDVIQLIDNVMLPIPFRVEKGGGPALCGDAAICTSMVVTNDNPNGDVTVVPANGNKGPIAGAVFPDGWLPVGPGLPTSVVVTIKSVNTGVNDVAAGTQANPCHANLPLEQFNGCFDFSTTPALGPNAEGGHQFARPVTVVVCYVLHDSEDPRMPWAQLWSSGPNEPAHPLVSVSDALVLTVPSEHNCGSNFVEVIGSGSSTNPIAKLASAGWRTLKGEVHRLVGVKTAYAVDLGLGGYSLDFSHVGPALTAQIQRVGSPEVTLAGGVTTVDTVRIVGTRVHNGGALGTGIGGLPVTFTVAPGNGTLRLIGSEAPPAATVTAITNTLPIDGSAVSGGGFAPVNWTMPTVPGTYTLTATGPAIGGPITFTATVAATVGFSGWGELAAGSQFTCGLSRDGPAFCWGVNLVGSLGDGTTINRNAPVALSGGIALVDLAAGEGLTSCGLTRAGAAYCWGRNSFGQLGNGSTGPTATAPSAVAGGIAFASLAVGDTHVCGLTSAGVAYCWGYNGLGQLGDGTQTDHNTPVPVSGGLTFTQLTAGVSHTCGLTSGGAAYCWGSNVLGAVGNNGSVFDLVTAPVAVAGGITFSSLSAGRGHTCGLNANGAAYCWGYNLYGQLGDGTTTNASAPVQVGGGTAFAAIFANGFYTCALTSAGSAYCWGADPSGVANGTTTNRTSPLALATNLTFASLTLGETHICGLTIGGAAYCLGDNSYGSLGDGTNVDHTTPVPVVNP